jgi:hypothetical protein
MVAKTR